MIDMVLPLLTCWVCSLLVLRSVARPCLRARQSPLLRRHTIPCHIAVVPPTRAHGWDGCQCLGARPWRSREEGNAHKQTLCTIQYILQSTTFDRSTRESDGLGEDATAGSRRLQGRQSFERDRCQAMIWPTLQLASCARTQGCAC